MSVTKSYEEVIDFIAAGTTPEALVAFHPSDGVQQRVADLIERSNEGSISAEDQSELEDYLQLEHIMIIARRGHASILSSRTDISKPLRRFVAERAAYRCEYCLLHEDDSYSPHQVDHIISRKHGGQSGSDNLA